MGVERVDYCSYDESQQALQYEQKMQDHEEQELDQIDMMSEDELREELRKSLVTIEAQRRGEFICSKCGFRQEEKIDLDEIPF